MVPEPFSDHVPPEGDPANVLVLPSQIAAVLVVLAAVPGSYHTLKALLEEVLAQLPFAAIV